MRVFFHTREGAELYKLAVLRLEDRKPPEDMGTATLCSLILRLRF